MYVCMYVCLGIRTPKLWVCMFLGNMHTSKIEVCMFLGNLRTPKLWVCMFLGTGYVPWKHTHPQIMGMYVSGYWETYAPTNYGYVCFWVMGNIRTPKLWVCMFLGTGKHTYLENDRYVCMSGFVVILEHLECILIMSENLDNIRSKAMSNQAYKNITCHSGN